MKYRDEDEREIEALRAAGKPAVGPAPDYKSLPCCNDPKEITVEAGCFTWCAHCGAFCEAFWGVWMYPERTPESEATKAPAPRPATEAPPVPQTKTGRIDEGKLRDGKWPHDHCNTCGANQGTGDGECASDFGGDHAETEEYSEDWTVRAGNAEDELARLRPIVGLAHRFVLALGGAKLRKRDLDALDPLMRALNGLPMQDVGRYLDACVPVPHDRQGPQPKQEKR